jgi:hypothetical protein
MRPPAVNARDRNAILGPNDHAHQKIPESLDLLDLHEPFASAITQTPALIYGRKGCGKSAALRAHQHFGVALARLQS